ncbi:MAG: hypothetical protein ACI841_002423 [Planctomycetota bacterium]|jgi:hypothetical protein
MLSCWRKTRRRAARIEAGVLAWDIQAKNGGEYRWRAFASWELCSLASRRPTSPPMIDPATLVADPIALCKAGNLDPRLNSEICVPAVVRRGARKTIAGVIGGSSAGATILGS